jgi:hypothetical protein
MHLKQKPYRLIALSRIILARLYVQHVNDDPKEKYSPEEVAAFFAIPISLNLIRSALEKLDNDSTYSSHLVLRKGSKKAGTLGYVIGPYGMEVVEKAILKKNSDIAHYIANGDTVIDEIASLDASFFTAQERMDADEWTPLDIDRADPIYLDAVNSVEEAIEAIRQDNGFAATYPQEREGILRVLHEGLVWLKEKVPTQSILQTMLISPLRWVSSIFGNAVVGEVAKKAAQKVVDFLSTFYF